jgi:hypothetical protein
MMVHLVYVNFACYTMYCTCFEHLLIIRSELIISDLILSLCNIVTVEMYSMYFYHVNNFIIASQ